MLVVAGLVRVQVGSGPTVIETSEWVECLDGLGPGSSRFWLGCVQYWNVICESTCTDIYYFLTTRKRKGN